jgi:hypothetical protein
MSSRSSSTTVNDEINDLVDNEKDNAVKGF